MIKFAVVLVMATIVCSGASFASEKQEAPIPSKPTTNNKPAAPQPVSPVDQSKSDKDADGNKKKPFSSQ